LSQHISFPYFVQDDNLTLFQGGVFNPGQVTEAMAGANAVTSGLGPVRSGPDHLLAAGSVLKGSAKGVA
jgi:hypothetical protein